MLLLLLLTILAKASLPSNRDQESVLALRSTEGSSSRNFQGRVGIVNAVTISHIV